jgi:hypothetical protein
MIMAFGNTERLSRGASQRPRLFDLFRIEIDVRVEVADHGA